MKTHRRGQPWAQRIAPILLLFACALWAQEPEKEKTEKPIIVLQVMGEMPEADITAAKSGILGMYDAEVKLADEVPLPASAWYEPRSRYKADKLLTFLETRAPKECLKIVGLTSKDISTSKGEIADWGIFGLGSLDGKTCVISTFRLRAGDASIAKMHQRLVKVINHEIGHTFGLEHCPVEGCLMQDAEGTIKTVDGESGAFCESCTRRLAGKLK